eukprot:7992885-Alexandrium_andersonii.AAC.1
MQDGALEIRLTPIALNACGKCTASWTADGAFGAKPGRGSLRRLLIMFASSSGPKRPQHGDTPKKAWPGTGTERRC